MKINLIYKVKNKLCTWKLFFLFNSNFELINFYYNHNKLLLQLT